MNKTKFLEVIAEKADVSKATATQVVDAVLDTIAEALAQDDTVVLVGFGSFAVRARAARVGRHPQTGAEINIKASKVVSFKPGKGLKDAIQGEAK